MSAPPRPDTSAACTRRTLLRRAVAGGLLVATASASVPAWARPARASALRGPGSLPFPHLPPGTPSLDRIEHIVVLMLENHSFDSLLGMLPHRVAARRHVDGLRVDRRGRPLNANPDGAGNSIRVTLAPSPCQYPRVPSQSWNASHQSYDGGRNDGFVRASGPSAMLAWDDRDLPVTYSLARRFPIGERYFGSVLAQTYPNRRFLYAATASGTIATSTAELGRFPPPNGTIFDRLDAYGVSWMNYSEALAAPLIVPGVLAAPGRGARFASIQRFYADATAGRLPHVSFVDPDYLTASEENPQDIQVGERFVHDVVTALMHAPTWQSTALMLTYDEHGGYYDHVPPPRAVAPDATPPRLGPGDPPGGYDRYGFRVPLIVVSPWARPNYVSRVVQDHTSILKLIETKWNLPALTYRDANAANLTDYFDFHRAAFRRPPPLAAAPSLTPGLRRCQAQGLSPPLPGPTGT